MASSRQMSRGVRARFRGVARCIHRRRAGEAAIPRARSMPPMRNTYPSLRRSPRLPANPTKLTVSAARLTSPSRRLLPGCNTPRRCLSTTPDTGCPESALPPDTDPTAGQPSRRFAMANDRGNQGHRAGNQGQGMGNADRGSQKPGQGIGNPPSQSNPVRPTRARVVPTTKAGRRARAPRRAGPPMATPRRPARTVAG